MQSSLFLPRPTTTFPLLLRRTTTVATLLRPTTTFPSSLTTAGFPPSLFWFGKRGISSAKLASLPEDSEEDAKAENDRNLEDAQADAKFAWKAYGEGCEKVLQALSVVDQIELSEKLSVLLDNVVKAEEALDKISKEAIGSEKNEEEGCAEKSDEEGGADENANK